MESRHCKETLKRFGASETCDIATKRDSQIGFSLCISPLFTFLHSLEMRRGRLIKYMFSALVDAGIRKDQKVSYRLAVPV